jgi:hypothetical protein
MPRLKWNDEWNALLGTDTDTALAERFMVSKLTVLMHRRKMGVKAADRAGLHARAWTKEEDALLGTMIDPQAAEKLGVSSQLVAKRRQALKIEPYRLHASKDAEAQLRAKLILTGAKELMQQEGWTALLGKIFGVSRQYVQQVVTGATETKVA